MKKMISLLVAVLMLAALFAGCGAPASPGEKPENDNKASEQPVVSEETAAADETSSAPEVSEAPANVPSSTGTVADAYAAYIQAKGNVVTKISDGLSNNPDTALTALTFLGVAMVDAALIPASLFGLGQEAVEAGLAMLGATDVEYTENGNSYTVTYKDEDGKTYSFAGTYDTAADVLTCTASTDGQESVVSEYHKTPFGYIGQYYMVSDDGTASIYQIAVQGEDGTIGISSVTAKPAALTGSEAADFPKACDEWYSITGSTITGKTSDGADLNFEYTPSESASN
jgi:predicted small lipoprotein YifL